MQPLSRPDPDIRTRDARGESGELRAGGRLAFQFHRRRRRPQNFFPSLTYSLIPSLRRIRRIRLTEITTRAIVRKHRSRRARERERMVKQIHNLVLTRSHAKEAFGFRIIGGKEQGLTFKVRMFGMRNGIRYFLQ